MFAHCRGHFFEWPASQEGVPVDPIRRRKTQAQCETFQQVRTPRIDFLYFLKTAAGGCAAGGGLHGTAGMGQPSGPP